MTHAHDKHDEPHAAAAKPKASGDLHKTYSTGANTIAAQLRSVAGRIDGTVITDTSRRDNVTAELKGLAEKLEKWGVDHEDCCPVP